MRAIALRQSGYSSSIPNLDSIRSPRLYDQTCSFSPFYHHKTHCDTPTGESISVVAKQRIKREGDLLVVKTPNVPRSNDVGNIEGIKYRTWF